MLSRPAFLAALGSALLPLPASAAAPIIAIAQSTSGEIGICARLMNDGPPFIAYRDTEVSPTASIIKTLILATAYQEIDVGRIAPSTPVAVRASDLVGGSEIISRAGTYTLRTLMNAMIRQSDNSASNALISQFGFERINATAQGLGLTRTRLARHFLDWSAIVIHNENVSCARDMATLLYSIERGAREGIPTVATAQSCREMIGILLGQEDREKIVAGLPAGVPVANKTGEITGVRNDIAIVDPFGDVPFILAVMTNDVTNYARATSAIRAVARTAYAQANAAGT